jgi:hypothetical protein
VKAPSHKVLLIGGAGILIAAAIYLYMRSRGNSIQATPSSGAIPATLGSPDGAGSTLLVPSQFGTGAAPVVSTPAGQPTPSDGSTAALGADPFSSAPSSTLSAPPPATFSGAVDPAIQAAAQTQAYLAANPVMDTSSSYPGPSAPVSIPDVRLTLAQPSQVVNIGGGSFAAPPPSSAYASGAGAVKAGTAPTNTQARARAY